MRKLFLMLLIASFVIGAIPIPAQAGFTRLSEEREVETYVITNDGGTSLDTAISTSTIRPGKDRIIGFEISPSSSSTVDGTCQLYDCATTALMSSTTIFYAFETPTGTYTKASGGREFPYPKGLSKGLAVRQGGYTLVTILYEKYRP